jgi:hypothetical protein
MFSTMNLFIQISGIKTILLMNKGMHLAPIIGVFDLLHFYIDM